MVGGNVCDRCGAELRSLDCQPIAYTVSRHGRCRECSRSPCRIDILIWLIALVAVPVSASVLSNSEVIWIDCLLGWMLVALAWIDSRTFLLPDELTLPLAAAGVAWSWFSTGDIFVSLIGLTTGFCVLWMIGLLYRWFRGRHGIGLGDAKMLAAGGAWVGWASLPSVVLTATLSALIAVAVAHVLTHRARRDLAIPFGPHLALGIWLVHLFGPIVLQ